MQAPWSLRQTTSPLLGADEQGHVAFAIDANPGELSYDGQKIVVYGLAELLIMGL